MKRETERSSFWGSSLYFNRVTLTACFPQKHKLSFFGKNWCFLCVLSSSVDEDVPWKKGGPSGHSNSSFYHQRRRKNEAIQKPRLVLTMCTQNMVFLTPFLNSIRGVVLLQLYNNLFFSLSTNISNPQHMFCCLHVF